MALKITPQSTTAQQCGVISAAASYPGTITASASFTGTLATPQQHYAWKQRGSGGIRGISGMLLEMQEFLFLTYISAALDALNGGPGRCYLNTGLCSVSTSELSYSPFSEIPLGSIWNNVQDSLSSKEGKDLWHVKLQKSKTLPVFLS